MTFKKQKTSSILGLAFEGNRLEVVVLRRTNGHFQVQKSASSQLALSPLTGDPELVGREIRNVLDQAGIREKRCVVGIPLNWILTLQVNIPELPEADVESFLQLEAERGFVTGHEGLMIAQSRCQAGPTQQATLMAAPLTQIASLEAVLKAAQLRPVSLTPAITALQNPQKVTALALSISSGSIDLQISCGGGLIALRAIEGTVESEGTQRRLDADVVAREIRITLGQLPEGFQTSIKHLRVFGRGDLARRFVTDITPRAEAMGFELELLEQCGPGCFENILPAQTPLSPALALAAQYLDDAAQPFEFLPPRVSPWKRFLASKASVRKLGIVASAVGAVIAAVGGAFLYQEYLISTLENKIAAIDPQVQKLEEAQKQIRRYRPWFDESYRSLMIIQKLTEAFPEDGSVTAKTLEIKEASTVTCSGVARNNQSLLKVLEKLRATKSFGSVNVENIRGQAPVTFTFNLQWLGDSANAN